MSNVLELVSVDNEKVVIKVNAKDPLTVAMNPEFSSDMAYITVTRGEKHILTVIKNDGKTWSFEWGGGGSTMISDSVVAMKNRVIKFIEQNYIAYGLKGSTPVKKASIHYNDHFKSWQLTLRGPNDAMDHIWDYSATNENDMIKLSKNYIGELPWVKGIAITGITYWVAKIDGSITIR